MRSGRRENWAVWLMAIVLLVSLAGCADKPKPMPATGSKGQTHLQVEIDEPATVDFQCTTVGYTVAYNVFSRLVEVRGNGGHAAIAPSLAESWEESADGLVYTFHLRDGVTFSNGSALGSDDVYYTFKRMLTVEGAANRDIVRDIKGASALEKGEAAELEGFTIIDDLNFAIELEKPFSAFLASLAMPGASIMDAQSMRDAGKGFGTDPAATIGTGPYIFREWIPGEKIVLEANPTCFEGAPANGGVDLLFIGDCAAQSRLYRDGKLDILSPEELGDQGEYYLHGDVFADLLYSVHQVGIDYVAMNESIKPLDDVRVRKALQLSLDRQTLLDASYNGNGTIENGIFPVGLIGHNDDLEEIPYDPEKAKRLLKEAGYPDGIDLEFTLRSISTAWQVDLVDMMVEMWSRVGIRANITVATDEEFMEARTTGKTALYLATWAADYDDPDNFIYTFFGSRENTTNRSLGYPNEDVMRQVRDARAIVDEKERIKTYHKLEKKIVQEDAAWIPLFSRDRHYLVSERVKNFTWAWNGWDEPVFRDISIEAV